MFSWEKLQYCENKPEIVVDRGFWYLWALNRLGLKYRHETFGERGVVERFFQFKERTKNSGISVSANSPLSHLCKAFFSLNPSQIEIAIRSTLV